VKKRVKKKVPIVVVFILLIFTCVLFYRIFFSKENPETKLLGKSSIDNLSPDLNSHVSKRSLASLTEGSADDKQILEKYLNDQILRNADSRNLHTAALKLFGNNNSSGVIAAFFAVSNVFDSSPEFSKFMFVLDRQIFLNSQDISQGILLHHKEILENPFYEQTVLNLVARLNIDSKSKANLFGPSVDKEVQISPEGEVSASTANITTALILAKNTGVSKEDIQEYLEKSLSRYPNNSIERNELLARINAYFP
jgi:hypothetical protein